MAASSHSFFRCDGKHYIEDKGNKEGRGGGEGEREREPSFRIETKEEQRKRDSKSFMLRSPSPSLPPSPHSLPPSFSLYFRPVGISPGYFSRSPTLSDSVRCTVGTHSTYTLVDRRKWTIDCAKSTELDSKLGRGEGAGAGAGGAAAYVDG